MIKVMLELDKVGCQRKNKFPVKTFGVIIHYSRLSYGYVL